MQTIIDTETFVQILEINEQKNDVASVGTQVLRYEGDMDYLTKKYGLHKSDFCQSVDPDQIKHEFALFDIELKNKRLFTCESPQKNHDI